MILELMSIFAIAHFGVNNHFYKTDFVTNSHLINLYILFDNCMIIMLFLNVITIIVYIIGMWQSHNFAKDVKLRENVQTFRVQKCNILFLKPLKTFTTKMTFKIFNQAR